MLRARDAGRRRAEADALCMHGLLRRSALRIRKPRISFERDQKKIARELLILRASTDYFLSPLSSPFGFTCMALGVPPCGLDG